MKKRILVALFILGSSGILKAQDSCVSSKEYSIYSYLITYSLSDFNFSVFKMRYEVELGDSLSKEWAFSLDRNTWDSVLTFKTCMTFDSIVKCRCKIDKNRFDVRGPVPVKKYKKNLPIHFDFSRCYIFNKGRYALVYFSVYGGIGGEGAVYLLEVDGKSWKILKKMVQWVG